MYRLNKIPSNYVGDLTNEEDRKCKKDNIVFDGTDCFGKMLKWRVTFKVEPKKVGNKIVDYEIQSEVYIGSAFDTYIALKIVSNWIRIINIVKKGKSITSLQKINKKKKI